MTPDPKENKSQSGPPAEHSPSNNAQDEQTSGEENEDDVEVSLDEFESVNNYLDSLNSALDAIEQRNDDLKAQLLNLLQSNREIRQSMQEENAKSSGSDNGPDPEAAPENAMEH
ncbi:UPF0184 protein AAEL002161 [Topomyia yanbarensis]|uniref:UPF0184 protein AAEL002161 n=1 Tax=Topomyia yanbarensis TaxID=2498891 RepID=UPI00273BB39D|nr:UPF0184 protein AAEL002161 [Topomyia yanbarensis]